MNHIGASSTIITLDDIRNGNYAKHVELNRRLEHQLRDMNEPKLQSEDDTSDQDWPPCPHCGSYEGDPWDCPECGHSSV